MGTVISKAASGIGSVLGTAFVAPFKSIFNGSCEDVCPGPWDIICFIEHLCVTNLVKLLMILGLCYITFVRCWAACETYWYALEDITCFLWHKLLNTKRRNRRRRIRDAEWGYSSSSDGNDFSGYHRHLSSRRKRYMERNDWYGHDSHCGSRHHHVKLKTRQASFHLRGGGSRRLRNSRRLHSMKVRNPRRISKRRRLK
ncbi:transmembrane protein [Citrus sinensis]|uniref:Transmembrane protein n=1 Tax=Citrus sinensis TaxID=2711 RepID=A0ACB8JFC7_CITSI|nr:transmembrane protein [Citrus sinensis]